jgi:hypothetical protein
MWLRSLTAIVAVSCMACEGPAVQVQHRRVRTIGEASEGAKARLAATRIFFGHQSVGTNILDGLAELGRTGSGPRLNILSPGVERVWGGGVLEHAFVGRNGSPMLKTDDFARRIESGVGSRADIALHKYCYVDFQSDTDAAAVFAHYRKTMARLHEQYPNVTFVHVTVPLTVVQGGRRGAVKRLLGIAPDGFLENVQRERFNGLMRREYQGREPLFDLAAIEATNESGAQQTVALKGQEAMALLDGYTSDGGHLNEVGRRRVAEELLVALAELPATR